jgi:hypothetical protein
MVYQQPVSPSYALNFRGSKLDPYLAYVWDNASGTLLAPKLSADAAAIDGVTDANGTLGLPAITGLPVQMTASAAISEDDDLEVGADGKVETAGAGVVVARALEAAAADGDVIWCVFA